MRTIGDVLKLCRANRYTYKGMTPEIKEEFQNVHKLAKTYADTPIFDSIYDRAVKISKSEKIDIVGKTWAIEYLINNATNRRDHYYSSVTKLVTDKLIKEKGNE
jgi:hypothetical protein